MAQYSPFAKARNFLLSGAVCVGVRSGFSLASLGLLYNRVLLTLFILIAIWSIRNYKVCLGEHHVKLKKIFGRDSIVPTDNILKIELESISEGINLRDMLLVHTEEKISYYTMTHFSQKKLLDGLTRYCAANSIVLETSKYKLKRFDFI